MSISVFLKLGPSPFLAQEWLKHGPLSQKAPHPSCMTPSISLFHVHAEVFVGDTWAATSPTNPYRWPKWKQGRPLVIMLVQNQGRQHPRYAALCRPGEVRGRCCVVAMSNRPNRPNDPAVLWRKKTDVVSLWILGGVFSCHLHALCGWKMLKKGNKQMSRAGANHQKVMFTQIQGALQTCPEFWFQRIIWHHLTIGAVMSMYIYIYTYHRDHKYDLIMGF